MDMELLAYAKRLCGPYGYGARPLYGYNVIRMDMMLFGYLLPPVSTRQCYDRPDQPCATVDCYALPSLDMLWI